MRGDRGTTQVAASAGISPETLRRIGTGRAPAPAFFTVTARTRTPGLSTVAPVGRCAPVAPPAAAP